MQANERQTGKQASVFPICVINASVCISIHQVAEKANYSTPVSQNVKRNSPILGINVLKKTQYRKGTNWYIFSGVDCLYLRPEYFPFPLFLPLLLSPLNLFLLFSSFSLHSPCLWHRLHLQIKKNLSGRCPHFSCCGQFVHHVVSYPPGTTIAVAVDDLSVFSRLFQVFSPLTPFCSYSKLPCVKLQPRRFKELQESLLIIERVDSKVMSQTYSIITLLIFLKYNFDYLLYFLCSVPQNDPKSFSIKNLVALWNTYKLFWLK